MMSILMFFIGLLGTLLIGGIILGIVFGIFCALLRLIMWVLEELNI